MKEKRGRPKIKPVVKRTILSHALKHRDTPRQALAVELKHLIDEMGEIPPSEETMIKLISQYRNNPISPIDNQWSLASLSEYPIPADALPMVMSICHRRIKQDDMDEYLTIREALWASRLYKLIEYSKTISIPPDVEDALRKVVFMKDDKLISTYENAWPVSELSPYITLEALVDDWAATYAAWESYSEEEGEPFDSGELDAHILGVVYEYWGERRIEKIHDIMENYDLSQSDCYKLQTLNLPISEIEGIVKSGEYKNWPNINLDEHITKYQRRKEVGNERKS